MEKWKNLPSTPRCLLFAAALFIFWVHFEICFRRTSFDSANICPVSRVRYSPELCSLKRPPFCMRGRARERACRSTEIKSSSRDLPLAYEIARNNIGRLFLIVGSMCFTRKHWSAFTRNFDLSICKIWYFFFSFPFRFIRMFFNASRLWIWQIYEAIFFLPFPELCGFFSLLKCTIYWMHGEEWAKTLFTPMLD